MIKYRREFRRFHRSFWGAVALLILLGFLLQSVAGSVYYGLVMGSNASVASPPVELQAGTAGNSTIYENGTNALVSVEPSGGRTDVEDYVDNNTTDLDSSADKGTHSNFTAQQYGPDLINDTLTEADTGGGGGVNSTCTNDYQKSDRDYGEVVSGNRTDLNDWEANNYVLRETQETTGSSANREYLFGWVFEYGSLDANRNDTKIVLRYYLSDAGEDWELRWSTSNTGSGTLLANLTATSMTSTAWLNITDDSSTTLYIFVVDTSTGGTGTDQTQTTIYIDVLIIQITESQNYELDLEVQWTSVDYDEPYEFLCIYGGTMGAENITVDVWNCSDWENLFTDLNSEWNNVSVGSYLDSSNFTIRFKGGTETGDTTQHSWNIDAALLHVWSAEEVLGSATTVTADAKARSNSYGKDRAVLRTTDANNTLHVFQLDNSNGYIWWWKSTDNGQTWGKQISSQLANTVTSFSVKKDSSNYIHLVYSTSGSVWYRKQLYTATSWGSPVQIASSNAYQPDVAIASYNNSWVHVVYDEHYTSGAKSNEVYVKTSTDGGTSFGSAYDLTYNEYTGDYTAGTFPSIVIDNTLGTYGHIYVTWFRGDTNLYLRRGNITSSGTVNWDGDSNVQTIASNMSSPSTTENTNMMHSAMYANGKYRVVYCESGTAKYRDWNESSWSSPISLATVSNYPSLTYDWDNHIYVFYQTNIFNDEYDIHYVRSMDTTPSGFGNAQNATDNNNGNRYVSTKLGWDNYRVEFVWTCGTSLPYQVKYNNIVGEGGQSDFNYVLKFVEKEGSNWKVRLKAYADSTKDRLDNCSIYIYDGSNSTQIVILNGTYDQQTGPWYDLAALDTEYIWMHVETSIAGFSYVYVYLEILVPNTTVYARYIITFEIT